MGCKRRIMKFAKWVGKQLKPAGIRLIRDLVVKINTSPDMSSKEKRDWVIARAKEELGAVSEQAIRVVIEAAVSTLKSKDPNAITELGVDVSSGLESD